MKLCCFATTIIRRYKPFAGRISNKNVVRVNARSKRGHLTKQLYKPRAHASMYIGVVSRLRV